MIIKTEISYASTGKLIQLAMDTIKNGVPQYENSIFEPIGGGSTKASTYRSYTVHDVELPECEIKGEGNCVAITVYRFRTQNAYGVGCRDNPGQIKIVVEHCIINPDSKYAFDAFTVDIDY